MSVFAIVMICFLGAILVVLALFILAGLASYQISLSRKSMAKKIAEKEAREKQDIYMIDREWWDQFEDIKLLDITTDDGLTLYGHLIEKPGDKLCILVHGYGGDWKEMNNYANIMIKKGFSVLAVECRGHGNSEGDMIGMGWLDRLDILKWIDLMISKNPSYKIVLYGLSMGAAATCMVLGEKLPKNVICAISDCAFDNVYRQFYHVGRYHVKLLARPTMAVFSSYVKRVKGFDMKHADAVKQLKKSNIPVLFIHGEVDTFVPVNMCYRLASAVPDTRKEIYIVKGAEHIMSYATDPETYKTKVNRFLNCYLK